MNFSPQANGLSAAKRAASASLINNYLTFHRSCVTIWSVTDTDRFRPSFIPAIFAGLMACLVFSSCSSTKTQPDLQAKGSTSHEQAQKSSSPVNGSEGGANPNAMGQNEEQNPNVIQPGFEFELSHPTDKGMRGKFRVDADGKLRLPYGVVLDVTSLTPPELQERVASAYSSYLKHASDVTITLVQKKYWIDVRGLVNKPGHYLIEPKASIDEILSLAGGIIPNSQAEYVQIQQKDSTRAVRLSDYYDSGNSSLFPPWQGGDIIFVQRNNEISFADYGEKNVIQVLGEVKSPGDVPYRPRADFLYYLGKTGGPAADANLGEIELIRWQNGHRKSASYDWAQSHSMAALQPGDMIIVHANQQTHFERTLQSASGIAGVLSAIAVLIIAL
jgi:protein involved in polysaccharide export with SLBB domain